MDEDFATLARFGCAAVEELFGGDVEVRLSVGAVTDGSRRGMASCRGFSASPFVPVPRSETGQRHIDTGERGGRLVLVSMLVDASMR
jgi:hypothetical protein